jgi:hypothetical protein
MHPDQLLALARERRKDYERTAQRHRLARAASSASEPVLATGAPDPTHPADLAGPTEATDASGPAGAVAAVRR